MNTLFYLTSKFVLNDGIVVGRRFNTDDVLAFDENYFRSTKQGLSFSSSVLTKTALLATDQTYEDSIQITEDLADKSIVDITMLREIHLQPSDAIGQIVDVGDVVNPESPLMIFEETGGDVDLTNLIHRVGDELAEEIGEASATSIKSKYAGTVIEIKAFHAVPINELHPSIQAVIDKLERIANNRLSKMKNGDPLDPVRVPRPIYVANKRVGSREVEGVLFQFFIKVENRPAAGDKFTTHATKGVVSSVFPRGEEPVAEDGEQVDFVMSPLSIVSRMTLDVFLNMWSNACMIKLKQRIGEILEED